MRSPILVQLAVGAAAFRRGRRIRPTGALVKVNLGSGLEVAPGWYNVDANGAEYLARLPAPLLRYLYRFVESRHWYSESEYVSRLRTGRHVHHDLRRGVPFPDESVDYIFCSHALEHFFRHDALRLMRDAHRSLKPGGRIRVVVPDLDRLVEWLSVSEQTERALAAFFTSPELPRTARHRYMYNTALMSRLLTEAGFIDIEQRTFRQGAVPDLDILDNRPDESLYVEATKPRSLGIKRSREQARARQEGSLRAVRTAQAARPRHDPSRR